MATNFDFYRMKSAMQLSYGPPKYKTSTNKNGETRRFFEDHGAIFIDAANGENKVYNWKDKINFAISGNDIPIILKAFLNFWRSGQMDLELIHDPGAGSENKGKVIKKLTIKNAEKPGTFFMTLQTNNNQRVSVSLDMGEIALLDQVFKTSVSTVLGFGTVN